MTATRIPRAAADQPVTGRRKVTYRDEFGDIRRRGRIVAAKPPIAVLELDARGNAISIRGSLAYAAV